MLVENLQYLAPSEKSDHVYLVWNYNIIVEDSISKQKKFNYWKGNYEKMSKELMTYDWKQMQKIANAEEAWTKLKS